MRPVAVGSAFRRTVVTACGLCAGIAPLAAHHSFAAEYDGNLPVAVSGIVAQIDWQNPHVVIYVDARDDQGQATRWKFLGFPPSVLVRRGWQRDTTLKVGDTVTVAGWRARVDPHEGAARDVTFADGTTLVAGSQAEFTQKETRP